MTVENVIAHARGSSALIAPRDQRLMEDISISNVQMTMQAENTADKRATHALMGRGTEEDEKKIREIEAFRKKKKRKWVV